MFGARDHEDDSSTDDIDPSTGRRWAELIARSPYRRTLDGGATEGQSYVSTGVHAGAWLLAATWFIVEIVRDESGRTVTTIMLVSSTFLPIAPFLVARWEARLQIFENRLQDEETVDDVAGGLVSAALSKVRAVRYVVLLTPVVLITVAFAAGDRQFADEMALPRDGLAYIVGLIVLQLGSLAAGWGVLSAAETIALSVALTRRRADFAPYAGVTSHSSRALSSFCFSTALIFGTAGAVLLPGLCAAAWVADGVARAALVGTIVIIVAGTASLLAVPATVLSRRGEDDRAAYLDRLSRQIDALGRAAADPNVPFDNAQYVRLRALLEMRNHVVRHTVGESSVELVKRIPVAVLLPTASILASWLSLVVS